MGATENSGCTLFPSHQNRSCLSTYTVVFTVRSSDESAASRMALIFSKTTSVWRVMSSSITCPLFGSRAVIPATKTKPLALIACEKGPTGFGALIRRNRAQLELPRTLKSYCRRRLPHRPSRPLQPARSLPRFAKMFSVIAILLSAISNLWISKQTYPCSLPTNCRIAPSILQSPDFLHGDEKP